MIAAIIPAYNEEKRIGNVLEQVSPFVDEIIVIDDASSDGTVDAARRSGCAHILRHAINRGQGAALQTGAEYALLLGADILVHFDADGQMKASEIPRLIEPLQKGEADIVLGSRFLGSAIDMPLTRRWTLTLSKLFTRMMSGVVVTDATCGFRALSRQAAEMAAFRLDRRAHASEVYDLIHIHKLRYREVPVTITYTKETLEKGMSFSDSFHLLREFFGHKFFG
jgi:glycosyltransferase involved in cell wall biosynthesis